MSELEKECEHPVNFRGLNPEDFAREFGNTNYIYQEKCFEELGKEYKRQSQGDRERGRAQLSSGLENLSTAFYLVVKSINKVCDVCKKYMKNPFNEQYF